MVTHGCVIDVEMSFLDAFAMVALRIRETKEPLLEKIAIVSSAIELIDMIFYADLLFLVPEGECDVLETVGVGNASNSVFTPSVSSGSCIVVGKVWGWSVSGLQLELVEQAGGGRSSRLHASPSGL